MSKALKICLIILLLITFSTSFIYATENESSESESITEVLENEEQTEEQSDTGSSLDTLSTSNITKISSLNSYEQANLELNNILCIILIAIGVLLILFAIALLIRLSK